MQPRIFSCHGAIATIAMMALMLPESCHLATTNKSYFFADAFGILPMEQLDQSAEFLALISSPAQVWLSSSLPLTAPPLPSLLAYTSTSRTLKSKSKTHTTWSSLALPADLSYVCDEDGCYVVESDDDNQERPIMKDLLGGITRTTAAVAQSAASDTFAKTSGGSSRIYLTSEEQQLFQLLVDFRNECCPATTIRVAGGWVRDKLLAYQQDIENGNSDANAARQTRTTFHSSKDIDLVTSNISGQAFAYLLRGYLNKRRSKNPFRSIEKQDYDLEFSFPHLTYSKTESSSTYTDDDGDDEGAVSLGSSKRNYVSSNPLQTATFQIGGFDIDVCHLRKDQYDGTSRVPTQTQLASAAEDAWRRDLTINSLFYNLHSNQIEDWTEQGLKDLLSKRAIATPKAPLPTLLQDPLRILRAIRFAAQFSYAMDPKLIKAAQNPQVQSAINAKLSQSRRAKEMDAIFRTSNPSLGIGFLLDTDLLSALLPSPIGAIRSSKSITDIDHWEKGFLVLLYTQRLASQVFVKGGDWKDVNRRFLWYAALLQPFYHQLQNQQDQDQDHKTESKRSKSRLFDLLNSKLMISKSDVQSIESIIRGLDTIPDLLNMDLTTNFTTTTTTSGTGLDNDQSLQQSQRLAYYEALVRIGPLWKEMLLLHFAIGCQKGDVSMSIEKAIYDFKRIVSKIRNLGLDSNGGNYGNIFGLHPLLTGAELMRDTLPRLSQGKLFKKVMEEQKRWQICHLDAITTQSKEAMVQKLTDHLQKCFPDYV
ncbi:unnamed protein product [Cylindrotheca closterium]|uniref:Poly A polymerase head domain-containing protein n=1 Tax=Cylindrotheca closterium TaxID=2856 RepID=A0AAD2CCC2_9STRA|nr:unnamed protein product [Cylindrotheca closterium]